MKLNTKIGGVLAVAGFVWATQFPAAEALAGDQPFVGEMIWVPFNFAPKGWALCNGQLLPISQNTALFSLLGTQYGGNGTNNFALPDMQGRLMINAGQGAGLSDYVQGESGGEASHTLSQAEMPTHSHAVVASTVTAALASTWMQHSVANIAMALMSLFKNICAPL